MGTIKIRNYPEEIQVGKIICVGRNYPAHVKEMKNPIPEKPVLFIKPSSAIAKENDHIVIPPISKEAHYEAELIAVIGKTGKKIDAGNAYSHVLGYGIGLDMTLRDIQNQAKSKGLPWSIAKGFDTSAPVSEIITGIADPSDLRIKCTVNGELRQDSPTREMIFPVDKIIEFASSIFTLERGDIIFTGTPDGVGPVKDGDLITAELDGYVKITFKVRFDACC